MKEKISNSKSSAPSILLHIHTYEEMEQRDCVHRGEISIKREMVSIDIFRFWAGTIISTGCVVLCVFYCPPSHVLTLSTKDLWHDVRHPISGDWPIVFEGTRVT